MLLSFVLEYRKQIFLGEWELPAGTVVLGRVPLIQMTIGGVKAAQKISTTLVFGCFALVHTVLLVWTSREA
jgi:hypothetical protein